MGSMKDQLGDDLFNYEGWKKFQSDSRDREHTAKSARDEAVARVEKNAREGWADAMMLCVEAICSRSFRFTADDVFDLADRRGIPPTHDTRAFGPVMMRAARRGLCEKADCMAVPTRRASSHARPLAVWQSKIFVAAQ